MLYGINEIELINSKAVSYGANLPVVKNRTNEEINFYEFGFREFGENRLTDFNLHKSVYKDINYHFIAPIQSEFKEIVKNFKYIYNFSPKNRYLEDQTDYYNSSKHRQRSKKKWSN